MYSSIEKRREYDRKWYFNHKDIIRLYKRKVRSLRLKYIQSLKQAPCKDYGQSYPFYVMDFDHISPIRKKDTINRLAGEHAGWSTLNKEIEGCEIVCANCHRIRTHNRILLKSSK